MLDFLNASAYFAILLTVLTFCGGNWLNRKLKSPLMNPILISALAVIAVLSLLGIDYQTYRSGANLISWLLTPATVCLAVPLYEQLTLLKKNWAAVLCGILSGTLTSMGMIALLSKLFGFDHANYVTLLPKSITTAIGMPLAEEMGGYGAIAAIAIIITGVFGNILAPLLCRAFRITDPVAKGIAIGTSSHAVGTAKAMELGPIEGAMSSLSIVVAGILTVIFCGLFEGLI